MIPQYEVRVPLVPLKADGTTVDLKTRDPLQRLDIDGLSPLSTPICINGHWFLPASLAQAEQLNSAWSEARK